MSFFEKWFVTTVQVVQTFTKTINLTTSLAGVGCSDYNYADPKWKEYKLTESAGHQGYH